MGIGPDGLTALPEEIEVFLRAGALDSWRESAKITRATPRRPKGTPSGSEGVDEAARRPIRDPASRNARGSEPRQSKTKGKTGSIRRAGSQSRSEGSRSNGVSKQPLPSVSAKPLRPREPVVRKPRTKDFDTLAALLGELPDVGRSASDIARELSAVRKAGGGLLLADRGGPIGCIAWTIVATVHRGPIGRITALVVTATERRKGTGRKLVDSALAALAAAGCTAVEAMSDIDIRNAHSFFRSIGFAQASYRFTRSMAQTGT